MPEKDRVEDRVERRLPLRPRPVDRMGRAADVADAPRPEQSRRGEEGLRLLRRRRQPGRAQRLREREERVERARHRHAAASDRIASSRGAM
jgi:hypothetical protein